MGRNDSKLRIFFSDVEILINESYNRGYKAKDEEMKAELKNLFSSNMLQTNQIA
ncbi:hypothetical protein [Pedobacter hartonius]|uniref:Uncharacterized protein n=1 Tax=Pedobacter hartonius TaxID=425514 RepID=A0A1H4E6U1_9SPHI|nr:hypothetical protein [Pedobacter hartonius]SEA80062.1 hypothetical protein SAMN05443550_105249 [Pedobacter hartonius]